ncbi:LAMI_0C06876g1_1 [Lachancea mirantina]|uniref:LAMI_0C06876g1_1 n=1 Tax=Lachancea mirantina TaxID=1230905 RepID=A0A1G4J407_9SACH|nr:LAMI_0C06876g1_1 [Lachancea mirantina]
MGAAYHILGRTVQPHQLSIATISAVVLLALPNPFATKVPKKPEVKAASAEEEKFIANYIKEHTAKAEKH